MQGTRQATSASQHLEHASATPQSSWARLLVRVKWLRIAQLWLLDESIVRGSGCGVVLAVYGMRDAGAGFAWTSAGRDVIDLRWFQNSAGTTICKKPMG